MNKIMTYAALASFLIISNTQAATCDNLKGKPKETLENYNANEVTLQRIIQEASKIATEETLESIKNMAQTKLERAKEQMERNSNDRDKFMKKYCK